MQHIKTKSTLAAGIVAAAAIIFAQAIPHGVGAQSQVVCDTSTGVCAQPTLNPTEVAEVNARVNATATPVPQPVLALAAGAGTGASISFIAGSNAQRGAISWTAGTSPAAGTQFVATFPQAFDHNVVVPCVAANRPAATLRLYSTPSSTNVTVGADAAPTNGTTYICQYVVVP